MAMIIVWRGSRRLDIPHLASCALSTALAHGAKCRPRSHALTTAPISAKCAAALARVGGLVVIIGMASRAGRGA